MDSHFHGNDKKKRGNDMREGGKIVPPFYYEIATDDIQLILNIILAMTIFRNDNISLIFLNEFVLKCFK